MDDFWRKVCKEKSNIRFYQSSSYSPYSEFSRNWMEEQDGITKLGINSFYRYDSVMQPLFAEAGVEKRWREWIFDLYMHYLTELEYRNGLTAQEYEIRRARQELEEGAYGEEIRSTFVSLSDESKYYVSHSLWRQSQTRASVDKFSDVLVSVLENGIVYKDKWNEKQLLLYINERENEEDKAKIALIQQLFQPLGYDLHVFWEHHFAVVGEEQTMTIDEIELL